VGSFPRTVLERFVAGEFSSAPLEREMNEVAGRLGAPPGGTAMRGIVAVRLGLPLETVSRILDWRSFEGFCASVLTTAGFEVRENLVLTKPRMQLDVVAWDGSVALSVDCKHWAAASSLSALAEAGRRQVERSTRLPAALSLGEKPIISAVVTLVETKFRFAGGAAVVPVHTLRDFAASALAYQDQLEVVRGDRRAPINNSLAEYFD
jgi:hypothetical protein